jgi:hypothetical protein
VALAFGSPAAKRIYASHTQLKSFARPIVPAFHLSCSTATGVFEIPLVVVSLEENNSDASRHCVTLMPARSNM